MKRIGIIFGLLMLLGPLSVQQAQTPASTSTDSKRVTRVMVTGDSIVKAQPDSATLMISVVTQAKRAIDAQQDNASKSDAVIRAIKAAVPAAEVKTSGYTVQPQRVYRENQPPTITGYEARNTVTATLSDLKTVGTVIDAASQAGANDIGGVMFTLKQDRPARDQALAEATREAVSKARVIAQALGGRVVRIVEVQEEGFRQPIPVVQETFLRGAKVSDAATPIEVGDLEISSRVQLVAEVETNL
ncbi:MAG TPA: SIMPL domain-containing protein [Pyrinomonadaceae bacterium]